MIKKSTDINPGESTHRANRTQKLHAGSGSMHARGSGEVSCAICGIDMNADIDLLRKRRASCPFYAQPAQTYMKP